MKRPGQVPALFQSASQMELSSRSLRRPRRPACWEAAGGNTFNGLPSALTLPPVRLWTASALQSAPYRLPSRWPAPVRTAGSPWVRALPPLGLWMVLHVAWRALQRPHGSLGPATGRCRRQCGCCRRVQPRRRTCLE